MEKLLMLLAFPIIWPFVAKKIWGREITWREVAFNVGLIVILVSAIWYAGRYSIMSDTEILNGKVTGKDRQTVSCEHSYSCNCRQTCSGSGKDRSCSETCDTCYEHSHDYDWAVSSTAGDFKISRVDRQGVAEPPRFSRVVRGDPVAREHTYMNYIRAVPESLFHFDKGAQERFAALLPKYPGVYDYQYADRVFGMGFSLPDQKQWNTLLAEMLKDLGPSKQVNAIIVFAKTDDQGYSHALESAWLGGKKNDVLVVVAAPEYPKISWVRVVSWTDKQDFKVVLRDDLMDLKEASPKSVIDIIAKNIGGSFVRKPMKDFAYLEATIEPPLWAIILAALVAVFGSVGLSFWLSRNSERESTWR